MYITLHTYIYICMYICNYVLYCTSIVQVHYIKRTPGDGGKKEYIDQDLQTSRKDPPPQKKLVCNKPLLYSVCMYCTVMYSVHTIQHTQSG